MERNRVVEGIREEGAEGKGDYILLLGWAVNTMVRAAHKPCVDRHR